MYLVHGNLPLCFVNASYLRAKHYKTLNEAFVIYLWIIYRNQATSRNSIMKSEVATSTQLSMIAKMFINVPRIFQLSELELYRNEINETFTAVAADKLFHAPLTSFHSMVVNSVLFAGWLCGNQLILELINIYRPSDSLFGLRWDCKYIKMITSMMSNIKVQIRFVNNSNLVACAVKHLSCLRLMVQWCKQESIHKLHQAF